MSDHDARSAAEVQRDLPNARSRLDQTLSEIERRLAPGRLMEDGLGYLRNHGAKEYVLNLGDAAKRDPIPLALVGVGIAWLMLSSRRGATGSQGSTSASAISRGIGDTVASVKEAGANVMGTVSDIGDKVSQTTQKISGTVQSAMERTRELGGAARHGAQRVRGSYDYLVSEQPLAIGAIGLALGVAIAAAASRPRTQDGVSGDAASESARAGAAEGRHEFDSSGRGTASAEGGLHDRQASDSPTAPAPTLLPASGIV